MTAHPQNEQPPNASDPVPHAPEPRKNSILGKVVLGNLLLALFFFVSAFWNRLFSNYGIQIIIAQITLNFGIGLILLFTRWRELGKALLVSAFTVAILGYGTCLWIMSSIRIGVR